MTDAERLESYLADLARQVDDLSAIVARQDAEIARLSARVERLTRREAEREAEGTGGHVFGDERPPHY
ncbi:Protein SlyX [Roseivivax jejudonensis]|uniref:Protein SlyX n=1 Tax=Roseivivax jejudonensis TaxID=1529041 RepID=A0A1X7A7P3_9RHOB|nr:SlyX family protein [Roseivivax jejudonensis]SLN72345.1 Protein SlyX [Roseivivax jejudonensis]